MSSETEVEHQIRVVEERLRTAMLASDVDALDELVSSDLIFTSHTGQVFGKQDDLSLHQSGRLKLQSLLPSETRISVNGRTAIVSVRMKVAGSFDGAAFEVDLRYTRVWCASETGGWMILAGHCGPVLT